MIYTLGETVLDIIIENFDNVNIKVGGSMLNSAISLGRLGVPVSHVSYLSQDVVSERILDFLEVNHVGQEYICKEQDLRTNLALAFLDKEKKADYTFYKNTTLSGVKFSFPKITNQDIVLFGSFFSLNADFRMQLVDFLKEAKACGAYLIYDPNFRKPHLDDLISLLPFIEENLKLANLVKASDEDFKLIFNTNSVEEAWGKIKCLNVEGLVYTMGAKGAVCINDKTSLFVDSLVIESLSTIGAGDTFNAGIIYYLYKYGNFFESNVEMNKMLNLSHEFSSHVCQSMDNYLSVEFANKIKYV